MISPKTDNSDPAAKVMLRQYFLKQEKENKILDLFQGQKIMYQHCYKDATKYKGFDLKAANLLERANNKKAILFENLDDYNFFDLDAYGSPWELFFNIIIRLKEAKGVRFVVTDGLFLNNRYGSSTILQKAILNIPKRFKVPNFHRHYYFFLSCLFQQIRERTGYALKEIKQAITINTHVRYIGFTLERGY